MSNKKRNKFKNKEVGTKGEDLACQYLEQIGYEILKRNYYDKVGEIDIIAYKDYIIHFIEVKSVSRETKYEVIHETFGSAEPLYNPAEKVDRQKIRKIEKVAEGFLFENGLEEEAYQLDLIMIFIYDGGFRHQIEVIENINVN